MSNDNQKAFSVIYTHLMTQGARSIDDDAECVYRGSDGKRCAIGALLSDEHYKKEFEGRSIKHPDIHAAVTCSGYDCDLKFLSMCQGVHDTVSVENWDRKLRDVASRFGLTVPVEVSS